ncbi:hypothetical protein [Paeniglutamicibacter cryotolerans]|uniref:Drug/metabolite transporter (DMT)-like permease n=1 Tax=Paeniglutamicibacter cryotolerans TaxID=670079 RepID=A0A839QLU4_9MICC|nr:hypothetical protein [Paeniglutamicibacter cryotolerans]MBB2994162.1 drug/metabolite transporter (DMT)-like permease [Paeniglutamicibacter cryotolerans]
MLLPPSSLSRAERWKWRFVTAGNIIMLLVGAISPFTSTPMNPLLSGALILMGILFTATGLVMLRGLPKRLGPLAYRRIVAVAGLVFGLAGLLLALFALGEPDPSFPKRYSRGFMIVAGFAAAVFMGSAGIVGLFGKNPK